MSRKSCARCGLVEHHCEVCRQMCEGCLADERKPQNCSLCANRGYIGNPFCGPLATCPECPRGARLKLWTAHERNAGHYVPEALAT